MATHEQLISEYRRAFRYLTPYWRGLFVVILLGLFSTGVSLVQPYISRSLIDNALLRHDKHALIKFAALMAGVSIVGFVLNMFSSYRYVRLSAECLFDMRLGVYRHLQRLSPSYFSNKKLGDIVSRLNNDIGEVQRICSDTLLSVLSNVLFLAGSVAAMLWLNWRLFLVSILLLPLAIYALRRYQGRLMIQGRILRERSADLGSFLIENLLGMRLIVSSGNEDREATRFQRLNTSFVDSMLSLQLTSFLSSAIPTCVLTLSTVLVFLYGGKLVIDGQLTIGGLIAFMSYHMRLLSPVQSILGIYTNLVSGSVALRRVFEVVDAPIEVMESPAARPLEGVRGDISFRNVCFRYQSNKSIIDKMSFEIPAGTLCVIIGPSGSGKSTTADLLLRLYDPQEGTISIDGHDLRELTFSDLRQHVGVVEQTPYFFRASIRENIAYGKPGASLDEIRACAKVAAIDHFIESLPNGYDTVLAERGISISVGERQRIALARALLRDPAILILDEPTSAVDSAAERSIVREFERAFRGRTTVLISHHLSLVEMADLLVVIDKGKVLETGTPAELLKTDSYLSRQFRLTESAVA